jgi:hypothetical protein
MDDLKQPERIKKAIEEEFSIVLRLLNYQNMATDTFRRFYVDGRIFYHIILDEENPTQGIKALRYIDPRKIRKVREIKKDKDTGTSVDVVQTVNEYFIYNDKGFAKTSGTNALPSNNLGGMKIAKDSIIHCTSGLLSQNGDLVQSYLHKAIKPLNQLRSMEDSLVIYRISRAPERRIFYVDVGNLPKMKAEQYLRDIMIKFKNRLVYDSATGEIRDDRKFMTMLEDFWLPRREGRGTEITTLPGGQNLGQMDDVVYFQQKLLRSLNVPISRLDSNAPFSFGRATEISRDEVKFAKFINRLRNKFAILFTKALERQLVLKKIITPEEWDAIKNNVKFKFSHDNYFDELKNTEILRDRIVMLRDIDDFVGKYYSAEWVRRNVLQQSDEDIEEIDEQIEDEQENPQYNGMLKQQMMQQEAQAQQPAQSQDQQEQPQG